MKNKISLLALVLILVTSLVVAGCAKPTPPVERIFKIGGSLPLSGFAAGWGIPLSYGVEMFADETNKAGGINIKGEKYIINTVIYDDKFDASYAEGFMRLWGLPAKTQAQVQGISDSKS